MGRVRIRQLGGRRRTMDLRGRAGCLQPVSIGIEQRGEGKWAPQAQQGVSFNNGGLPKRIDFRFRWRDADMFGTGAPLLDGRPQSDGQLLFDALYDIVADGELVELIHEHRTLTGTLRDADAGMTRAGWLLVSVTFEPQQLRAQRAPRPGPEPESTLAKVRRIWGSVLVSAQIPATLTTQATDAVAEGVGQVNTGFRQLDGAVESYRQARRGVRALGQAFAHAARQIQDATRALDLALDADPCALVTTDDASLWLDQAALVAKVGQGNRRMRQVLLQERELQSQASDYRIQDVHYAAQNTNLRTLAAYYWGTEKAHLWQQIAEFNQLEGALLAGGQTVIIPYPRGV